MARMWLLLNASFLFLQHVCCDCKKDFCSLCSVLQENLRRCSTCHLLQQTAFQRPQLMRLKVKDLRQYLILRNIPTDTCREKEDLVDLVLCHHGLGAEDGLDTSSLNSSRSQNSSFFNTHSFFSNYTAPSATMSSFQGELMGGDWTLGSGALAQVWGSNYPEGLARLLPAMCGGPFEAWGVLMEAEVPHVPELCAYRLSWCESLSVGARWPQSQLSEGPQNNSSVLTLFTSVSLS